MKAQELSDLGDDREGRSSGTTGSRRGERHRAVISTNKVSQNNKIEGLINTVSISYTVQFNTSH